MRPVNVFKPMSWQVGCMKWRLAEKWIQIWKMWIVCPREKLFNSLNPHGEGREQ